MRVRYVKRTAQMNRDAPAEFGSCPFRRIRLFQPPRARVPSHDRSPAPAPLSPGTFRRPLAPSVSSSPFVSIRAVAAPWCEVCNCNRKSKRKYLRNQGSERAYLICIMRSVYDGRWFCSERHIDHYLNRRTNENASAYRGSYTRLWSTSHRSSPKRVDYPSMLPMRPIRGFSEEHRA